MPKFRVTNPLGFWDGVHKHAPGTVIQLSPEDYNRLLSSDMEPMDAQAKKDLEECRRKWAPKGPDGKPLPAQSFIVTTSGDLNPNKLDDLRKMTPRGATVVSPANEAVEKVVRPETSSG